MVPESSEHAETLDNLHPSPRDYEEPGCMPGGGFPDADEDIDSDISTDKAFSLSDWHEVNDDLAETLVVEEDPPELQPCQDIVEVPDEEQVDMVLSGRTDEVLTIEVHESQNFSTEPQEYSVNFPSDPSWKHTSAAACAPPERRLVQDVDAHGMDCETLIVEVQESQSCDTQPLVSNAAHTSEETWEELTLLANAARSAEEALLKEVAEYAGEVPIAPQRTQNTLVDTFPDTMQHAAHEERASASVVEGAFRDDAFMTEFKRRRLFYADLERRRCVI